MRAAGRLLGLIVILTVLFLVPLYADALAHGSIAFFKQMVCGAAVCVVQVDLNDPAVRIDIGLPAKGIAHSESFVSLVSRHAPLAAVTGIYFDTRTLRPTGTIVTGGRAVYVSHVGTAVCFTPDNKVIFMNAKPGRACDLSMAECGFRTGPRLLADGHYALDPRSEGFRHPGLFGARIRTALGVTPHNKLLLVLVRTPVSFPRLATIMKTLGASNAVCLDGGTSAAMYYKGAIIRQPGRRLTNVVQVLRRTRFYAGPAPAAIEGGGVVITVSTVPRSQPELACRAGGPGALEPIASQEVVAVLADPVRVSRVCRATYPIRRWS